MPPCRVWCSLDVPSPLRGSAKQTSGDHREPRSEQGTGLRLLCRKIRKHGGKSPGRAGMGLWWAQCA